MDFSKHLPTPYKTRYSFKNRQHEIIYDDSVIGAFPKGTDIDFLQWFEGMLNGAYNEGYIQKERETGELYGNQSTRIPHEKDKQSNPHGKRCSDLQEHDQ